MNQRKGSSMIANRPVIIAVVVAILLLTFGTYWFAIRDDSSAKDNTAASGTIKASHLNVQGIPFSFEYPGNFALAKNPPGLLWIAGVNPTDIIDVRRIGPKELATAKLAQTARTALQKQAPGLKIVSQDQGTAGGKDVVRFIVTSNSSGQPLKSQLLFFSANGGAWQVECQSQKSGEAFIDAACQRVLETLNFS